MHFQQRHFPHYLPYHPQLHFNLNLPLLPLRRLPNLKYLFLRLLKVWENLNLVHRRGKERGGVKVNQDPASLGEKV